MRFAEQEVNMLGHEHVADNYETVTPPGLLQNACQQVTPRASVQLGLATVATAGNEMQVMLAVKTFQTLRHPHSIETSVDNISDTCWALV